MKRLIGIILGLLIASTSYADTYYRYQMNYTSPTLFSIYANTIDGSDSTAACFAGGGSCLTSRGAFVKVQGDDLGGAAAGGGITFDAGTGTAAKHTFSSNGSTNTIILSPSTGVMSFYDNIFIRSTNPSMKQLGIGDNTLMVSDPSVANVAIGSTSMRDTTTGYDNTAVGLNVLRVNTTGWDNTAMGVNTMIASIDGHENTAIGGETLWSNTHGHQNTAIGDKALNRTVVANGNTAVGTAALYWNTAAENTAVGLYALQSNSSGFENTAVGTRAGNTGTIGTRNTIIGFEALYTNIDGTDEVAIGRQALFNTTGIANVGVGSGAMHANSTGVGNTGVGYAAGLLNTTGSYSTFIGYSTGSGDPSYDNTIAIGYGAIAPFANTAMIGNTAITATSLNGTLRTYYSGSVQWTLSGGVGATPAVKELVYGNGVTAAITGIVHAMTSDGTDDSTLVLQGGGGPASGLVSTRGSYLTLKGNEATGTGGFELATGDAAAAAGVVTMYSSTGTFSVYKYSSGAKLLWQFDASTGSLTSDGTNGGDFVLSRAGKGVKIKEGANARMGTAACNGVTEVTVSNTSITATTRIFYSFNTLGGTPGGVVYTSARNVGADFRFKCAASDTSTVAWLLIEPS